MRNLSKGEIPTNLIDSYNLLYKLTAQIKKKTFEKLFMIPMKNTSFICFQLVF